MEKIVALSLRKKALLDLIDCVMPAVNDNMIYCGAWAVLVYLRS